MRILQPASKGTPQLSARGQMERRRPPFLRASTKSKEVKKIIIKCIININIGSSIKTNDF